MTLYLDIVEAAVTAFEPLWRDDSDRIPRSGFFDARKYDDWTPAYPGYAGIVTIPLNGLVDFCYAVLLTETDKPFFTAQKIPRTTLLDHAVKSIRWCCLTSAYVKNPYPYIHKDTAPQFLEGQQWRRQFGYRADEVGFLTLAAALLWDKLDAETQRLVEEVMVGIAPRERLVRTWEPPQGGNHDQVKQDMSSTIGAAFLFPWRSDQRMYWDIVAQNGLDLVSTVHDFARTTIVEGQPINKLAKGWNLYPDYSSDHHGWAQIWYGCDKLFEAYFYVAILSRLFSRPVPETFTYPGNGFAGVANRIQVLCLPESEPASVHGMEYDSYYGAGLLAFLYGSIYQKDPIAAALEERSASLLARHTRALPAYDYHRNNHAKAAIAYLAHRYGGGRAEPVEFNKAWQALSGTFHHPWWQNIIHRDRRKLASFSWGTISSSGEHFGGTGNGVCGYVIPARLAEEAPEPLIYLHPHSMTGESEVEDSRGRKFKGPSPSSFYELKRSDAHFQTSGRVETGPVEQRMAFFSFGDGPCVFMNLFVAREEAKLDWSGMPVYFYHRPGLTSPRTYDDATGTKALGLPHHGISSWWSVDNRLGATVLGGPVEVRVERTVGRNWARTDAYRDKCDAVFLSPLRGVKLQPGKRTGDLTVVFFPERAPAAVERAAQSLAKHRLDLPEGWRGVVVTEEGTNFVARHLALVNLDGETNWSSLHLEFETGAPILSIPSLVQAKAGSSSLRLDPFQCYGETISAYVELLNSASLRVQKLALGRYSLQPLDGKKVAARLTFSKKASALRVFDKNNRKLKEISLPEMEPKREATIQVDQEIVVVNLDEIASDVTAPALEIGRLAAREDGRVMVEIVAEDQSGIQEVEVYVDGNLKAKMSSPPWIWTGWPGQGYHTFSLRARDASPLGNMAISSSRTIYIPQQP